MNSSGLALYRDPDHKSEPRGCGDRWLPPLRVLFFIFSFHSSSPTTKSDAPIFPLPSSSQMTIPFARLLRDSEAHFHHNRENHAGCAPTLPSCHLFLILPPSHSFLRSLSLSPKSSPPSTAPVVQAAGMQHQTCATQNG